MGLSMTASIEPAATLSPLHRADGSATFSENGYTVIGAVNGPIEVQRRDELPEEATVDVIVRPAAGVGGTHERHLESILQSTLRQIILIRNFPRTLIQIILQITSMPEDNTTSFKPNRASSILPILPVLIQTSALALLSASMPLAMTMASTLLALTDDGPGKKITQSPTIREIQQAASIHVLAFSSHGDLLVVESEGEFTLDEWDQVFEKAQRVCCDALEAPHVDTMLGGGDGKFPGEQAGFLRSILEKVALDLKWRK